MDSLSRIGAARILKGAGISDLHEVLCMSHVAKLEDRSKSMNVGGEIISRGGSIDSDSLSFFRGSAMCCLYALDASFE